MAEAVAPPTLPTEPGALRAVLQAGLPGFADGRRRIVSLQVERLRRSSSRRRHPHPLTLTMALEVEDRAASRRGVQHLYGKTWRAGAGAQAWAALDHASLAPAAFADPVAHLPAHDLLVWAWPNDPGLPQLPALADAARLWRQLPAAARAGAECVDHVQAVRWEPEQRATLRATLQADTPRVLWGKTFATARAPALQARFAAAQHAAQHQAGAARVADTLGIDATGHTLWQADAGCQPLATQASPPCFAAAGRALASLHALPVSAAMAIRDVHDPAACLADARQRAHKIARVQPALAARAAALVDTLARRAATLPPPSMTLLHGDCHVDQFGWDEATGQVVIFDFDEFALGDPMQDLAAFVTRWPANGSGTPSAAACRHALLRAYAEAAPGWWQPAWLQWQRALQALLQATRAFVFQVPGWADALAVRLCEAEALAQGDAA